MRVKAQRGPRGGLVVKSHLEHIGGRHWRCMFCGTVLSAKTESDEPDGVCRCDDARVNYSAQLQRERLEYLDSWYRNH